MLFTRANSNSEISLRDVALNFSPTGNITYAIIRPEGLEWNKVTSSVFA